MARINRRNLICLTECRTYHVTSRCTRRLHLFGGSDQERSERKRILLRELERVATYTAVGVAGFALMDNHLHLLLKVDTPAARKWSDRQVMRRWLGLHPPRDGYRRRVDVTDEHVDEALRLAKVTPGRVDELRERLMSISHFMKEFKQEISQQINRLDDEVGTVWAGRFKSHRVTDEAQLLTTLAYIDLNPFAAGVSDTPEDADHTSLAARLRGSAEKQSKEQAKTTPPRRRGAALTEHRGWWMPLGGGEPGEPGWRKTLMPGTTLTLDRYLLLLDRTARLLRKGKRRLAADTQPILERINLTPGGMAHTLCDWFDHGLPWQRGRRGATA